MRVLEYLYFNIKPIAIGLFVGIVVASLILTLNDSSEELETCREEATAWYNATITQSDAIARWFLNGQPEGMLDFSISQNFATQGHELTCIENTFPRGE
jgi:hypothetical protein